MSTGFFLKGKPRNVNRKSVDTVKKKKKKVQSEPNLQNGHDTSDSDLEFKKFSDGEQSESDHETAEQKKVRLAKKYLEEIEREEANRADCEDLHDAIRKRLQRDYLQQKGKLKTLIAETFTPPEPNDLRYIRVREHRLSLTCVCVSSDAKYLFSGSKCGTIIKWSLLEKRKLGALTFKTHANYLKGTITAITITTDNKYFASSDESNNIQIWDTNSLKHIYTFKGHKDVVTGLVFRKNTHVLYSASKDRSVKIWSLDEMSYVETLFGHQSAITSIDALSKERAITGGGRDSTARMWKIVEETQLIFNGPLGSLDEVKLLDEDHFVSGGENGSICVWSVLKKKPLCTVQEAHGIENNVPRWITSLATLINSDIFASGSYDNNIRFWKVSDSYRNVVFLFSVEVSGFVNSIQFTNNGTQLYAAIGQEHKSGRWFRKSDAKNSLLIVNFKFKNNNVK